MERPIPGASPLRDLTILAVLFFAAFVAFYLYTLSWTGPIPRDGSTLVVGRDFLNFWMYGRTALTEDPSRFYDPQLYNAALRAMLGDGYPGQNWSYPPSVMLIAAPFGRLGYLPALILWLALGMALLIAVARRQLDDPRALLALVLSPAAVFAIVSGQSTLLTTAAMIAALAWLDSRPLVAGVLIGLLSLKPQVGIFFPVLLVAAGQWRTFAVAAATTAAIAAATAAVFGPQVWIDFVTKGIPTQNFVLADPRMIAAPFMPTIFMNLHAAGAGYAAAMLVQAMFAVLAAAAIFWAWRFRRNADPALLMALFFACSVFGVPYLLLYDTLPIGFAAIVLMAARNPDAAGRRLAMLAYWLPVFQMALGAFYIPGPALIAPAFAVYLLLQLKGRESWLPHIAPRPAAKR